MESQNLIVGMEGRIGDRDEENALRRAIGLSFLDQ